MTSFIQYQIDRTDFNSFAAKFLTNLFSRCHIYFNYKEHIAMFSSKLTKNLHFFYFYFQEHLRNIPNLSLWKLKIFKALQNICKQRDFKLEEVRMSKSPIGNVGSLLWCRQLATLAAKEVKIHLETVTDKIESIMKGMRSDWAEKKDESLRILIVWELIWFEVRGLVWNKKNCWKI